MSEFIPIHRPQLDAQSREVIQHLHVVQEGETLSAVAFRYRTTWSTLYSHPVNSKYRALRPDPNRIEPGDVIAIPFAR
jgi:hypothetical protein